MNQNNKYETSEKNLIYEIQDFKEQIRKLEQKKVEQDYKFKSSTFKLCVDLKI